MNPKSGFSRVLPYYRRYRASLALNLVLVVVLNTCVTLIPLLTRQLFDFDPERWDLYTVWLLALAAAIAGMVFCSHRSIRSGSRLGAHMETDMRRDLFAHLQGLGFSYYDRTKTGHIMARISNDLSTLSATLHQLPADLLSSVLSLCGALAVMFWMNWQLALVALLPLPLAIWLGLRSKHRFKQHSHRIREEIGQINTGVENAVMGIREVQSFANEEMQMAGFDTTNRRFCEAKCDFAETIACYAAFMIGFMRVHGVLLAVAGSLMYVFSGLAMADLLAFMMYARFMLAPIDRMVNFSEQYAQGVAALERFSEILSVEAEIDSNQNASALERVVGRLEFEGVSFDYAQTHAPVLEDINLVIEPGSVVALVGESGAGKTTLASLVPRFYDVSAGRITLDGADIRTLPLHWLRRQIGVVQQSPFLFDASIRNNIAFGRPGATDAEIVTATRQANLLDFIESLPDGLDTLVGERGVMLSGGQRQRISIARVFLKNPRILIFDEATSALDNESERRVQDAIARLFRGRTTLIIAHRLSSVKHADLICALRNGRIIESGTHQQLLDKRGYFHRLHQQGVL
jgi:ATP-binding cassette subfamily B protein